MARPLDRLESSATTARAERPADAGRDLASVRRRASFARVARGGTLATRVVRWGIERAAQSRLGAYELREQIGEGGFARVFRATGPQGEVAVKVLGSTGLDDASLRRFEREIDVLAKVRHPSLVSLLDSGIDDTHGPFLVMPLLVGLTFRDVLPATGLGPEGGIRLLTPVVQALGAMHAAGLVHRDLKPENVIVSPRGEVTLVDLGLALGLGQSRLTQAGAVAGSLPYMAPEQIDGDARTQSDVWSVGVVLYELITGKRPFARARTGEEIAAILAGRYTPLVEADRRVSLELDELMTRCLAPKPEQRPADAHELLEALEPLLDWAPPAAQKREVVSVLSDLGAYQKARATERLVKLREVADRAASSGDTFGALATLDRALAYQPDDPETLARLESVSSGKVLVSRAKQRDAAATATTVESTPTPRVPPKERRLGARAAVGVGAVVLITVAGLLVARTLGSEEGSEPDTSVDSSPAETTETPWETESPTTAAGAPDAVALTEASSRVEPAPTRALPGLDTLREIPAHLLEGGERIDLADNVRREGEAIVGAHMLGPTGPAGALAQLEAQLATRPGDPALRVGRALALLGNQREREGLAELEALAREHPRLGVLWGARGYVAMRLGRFEEADRAFSRAIELDPADADSLRNRGILRHRLARRAEGYADLRASLRYDPDDVNALAELAQIYERTGLRTDARPLLERVVRLQPTNAAAWVDLSMAQVDPDEALVSVDRAIATAPGYRRAYVRRCAILVRAQRGEAVDACTRAMEAAPDDPWMQMHRGLAHYHRGETEPALRDLNAAIARRSDDPVMFTNRYLVLQHAGRTEEARADLRAACDLGHEPACDEL
ncbi:MAG: protein kinase [Sandaracinus sp.]|nr:protein kinase [Sandaracinus sp.]